MPCRYKGIVVFAGAIINRPSSFHSYKRDAVRARAASIPYEKPSIFPSNTLDKAPGGGKIFWQYKFNYQGERI